MFNRLTLIVLCLAVLGAAVAWILSAPRPLDPDSLAGLSAGSTKAGEQIFYAGGCSSCHAAPKAEGDDKLKLTGGHEFDTPFGVFVSPNISPDNSAGIGSWSLLDFANAMKRGIRPDGAHYYPAFPYPSYSRMTDQDVADLWAFMQTLPEVADAAPQHRVPFPFNIRRSLGFWKLLYLKPEMVVDVPADNEVLNRGRYLVEALGHCAACHTPRNILGGPDLGAWMAGGATPDGKGRIPNITPHADGIGGWSETDIIYSLETGFTPEFDSFGSTMADVQLNMAQLPDSDRAAIAAYLKYIPSVASTK
ncbi:MAG: cytochrome c [Rhizobiaceae bacterium]